MEDLSGNSGSCDFDGVKCFDYDALDQLLPRYLRKVWDCWGDEDTDFIEYRKSLSGEIKTLFKVIWNPGFVAIPGTIRLSQYLENYKDLGYFPMDIASSLAVYALDLPADRPCGVLDLCCCPGAKLRMITDLVHEESVVVGVDISSSRLAVCKALMESWEELLYNRLKRTARQLLFLCDGTKFGEGMVGELQFDSSVFKDDLFHSKDHRKRKNKSSKVREAKRLKVIHQQIANVSGLPITERSPASVDGELQEEEEQLGVDVKGFNYVLVDAECTHDASYRHMKFVEKGHKWNNSATSDGTKLSLTHNIRDLKTSEEGRLSLQTTQRNLIENGFNRVLPGGYLVYSTCSNEIEQNEDIVEWLIGKYPNAVLENLDGIFSKSFSFEWSSGSILATRSSHQPSGNVSEEESVNFCQSICKRTSVEFQKGLLPGTIRVGLNSGMSGHFVARIRKMSI
jgi:16S rRNA C967 or C1407 C5-methylase (RsmB/RsmF family)